MPETRRYDRNANDRQKYDRRTRRQAMMDRLTETLIRTNIKIIQIDPQSDLSFVLPYIIGACLRFVSAHAHRNTTLLESFSP